jgi:hypothetical protein
MGGTAWFMSLLICSFLLAAQSPTPDNSSCVRADPYSIAFVQNAIDFFSDKRGHYAEEAKKFLYLSPSLPQLGDSVSIAILKIYDPTKLVESENANVYLSVLRLAFSDRNRVLQESDKDPKVTLFLLGYLQQKKASDVRLERRIQYMEQCVRYFSCSPKSEADYWKLQGIDERQ